MPTYQYRCADCGHDLEAVQAFTDAALTECPQCGQAALRKVFGSVGVVFKGSGFYRNDSRAESKGKNAATSAQAGSGKSSESGESGAAKPSDSKSSGSGTDSSAGSSSSSTDSSSSSSSNGSSSSSAVNKKAAPAKS